MEPLRDADYAVGAQRYMKSTLPYLGVRMPDLRRVWRTLLPAEPLPSAAAFQATLLELWDEAEFREERYTALAVVERYPQRVTIELLERLVVEGAWWDLVDTLARRVGEAMRRDPSLAETMRLWSTDPNLWKRRVSIICQLGFGAKTDLDLLYACIEPNLADGTFFVRKAIGWALRDLAWHDPVEVDRYIRAHTDRLSGLSRREATKNLERLLTDPSLRRG
ncbi:MAG: DNA alkylation repair protein [Gaiella sp.]